MKTIKRFRKFLRKTKRMMGGSKTPSPSPSKKQKTEVGRSLTTTAPSGPSAGAGPSAGPSAGASAGAGPSMGVGRVHWPINLKDYGLDEHERAMNDLREKLEAEYENAVALVNANKKQEALIASLRETRKIIKKAADTKLASNKDFAISQAKRSIQEAILNTNDGAKPALNCLAMATAVNANKVCGLAVDGSLKKDDRGNFLQVSTRLWKREKWIRNHGTSGNSFDYGIQGANQWEYNGRLKMPDWARNGQWDA